MTVYSDESDTQSGQSPDAKDIAPGTLWLRQDQDSQGDGRVYLIVVRSNSGSFAVLTVTLPKSASAANITSVNNQAAAAKAYAEANNGNPPPGYFQVGIGPVSGPKQ